MRAILYAAVVLLALQIAHTADHAIGHPAEGFVNQVPGYLGFLTNGAVIFLAARRDALAPLAAVGVGLLTAAGLVAIHLAPHWGTLSDPYSKLDLEAISWAIVIVSIGWSLVLAGLGVREMLARQAGAGATAT